MYGSCHGALPAVSVRIAIFMEALQRYRGLTGPLIAAALKKKTKLLSSISDPHDRAVQEHEIGMKNITALVGKFIKTQFATEILAAGRDRVGSHAARAIGAQMLYFQHRVGSQTMDSFKKHVRDSRHTAL